MTHESYWINDDYIDTLFGAGSMTLIDDALTTSVETRKRLSRPHFEHNFGAPKKETFFKVQ